MGGKSSNKSDQRSNTSNTNIGIHGDANGHVINGDADVWEYGDNYTGGDRTQTTVGDDFTAGNRTEVGDDFTGGDRTEIDGDYTGGDRVSYGEDFTGGDRIETDIDGDFYNGDYTVTDGGAFDMAENLLGSMIQANSDSLDKNLEFASEVNASLKETAFGALAFGSDAINSIEDANREALQSALSFGANSIDEIADANRDALQFGNAVMGSFMDQANRFSEELSDTTAKAIESASTSANLAMQSNAATTQAGLDKIEQIASTTVSGGQTVVAEQASEMVKWVSLGMAGLGLALILARYFK